ncbi:MAG: hypothetical protein ACYS9X_32850, partial [Planctomycetota bacterium]
MRTEPLTAGLILLSDCPRPVCNREVCEEIASHGARSLLVVDRDVTPWPSAQPGNLWCYVRPLADPDVPSPSELQRVQDFVGFERSCGRTVALWIGHETARKAILDAATSEDAVRPEDRPLPSDPCCCRPYRDGCDGRLVCHAAPVEAAGDVLRS